MSSKLLHLIELAEEPSSERRRELLREVTNLFFTGDGAQPTATLGLFDDVLSQLAEDMEQEVRAELAERMADASAPPMGLIRTLASDSAFVATPVLRRSSALTEADLLNVAATQGQNHLRAISGRAFVPEAVSEAIVKR